MGFAKVVNCELISRKGDINYYFNFAFKFSFSIQFTKHHVNLHILCNFYLSLDFKILLSLIII